MKPLVGISRCLLGENVRYDGGHKLDRFLRDGLGRFVDYAPVCPEAECGLGIPREAMRLVGDPASPRLVTIKTGVDLTGRMRAFSAARVEELAALPLCGFVFKSGSPSSGMERVKVYPPEGGTPVLKGVGLFTAEFLRRFPGLPVEEEGRLNDPGLRENFIERLFVMHRWRELEAQGLTPGRLVDFHTRHKLLVMAHSPRHYTALGRLVAQARGRDMAVLAGEYLALLMEGLRLAATVKKNVNALSHVMGYFKRQLTSDEKAELLEVLDAYARELLPLIVPVTLLNHYVRKFGQEYLAGQWYLRPHPAELKLRNHA